MVTWTLKREQDDLSTKEILRREPVQLDHGSLDQRYEEAVVPVAGGGELARQVPAVRRG